MNCFQHLLITRLLSFCPIICFEQTPLLNEILFRNSTRCNNLNEIFYKNSNIQHFYSCSNQNKFRDVIFANWIHEHPTNLELRKFLHELFEDFSKWCKVIRTDTHCTPRMIENNMPPLNRCQILDRTKAWKKSHLIIIFIFAKNNKIFTKFRFWKTL